MSKIIKIAVDAMGGDGSPKKIQMVLFIIFKKIKTLTTKCLETKTKF